MKALAVGSLVVDEAGGIESGVLSLFNVPTRVLLSYRSTVQLPFSYSREKYERFLCLAQLTKFSAVAGKLAFFKNGKVRLFWLSFQYYSFRGLLLQNAKASPTAEKG